MIVQLKLNDVPVHLLVDTGAKNTVIINPGITEQMHLENLVPVEIKGLGQKEPIQGFLSRKNEIRFNDLKVNHHTVVWLKDSIVDFSDYYHTDIDGVLGSAFLKNFVVEIRFASRQIVLHDPRHYRKKHKTRIPVRLIDTKPAIRFSFMNQDHVFLIDTGNTDAVWFYGKPPEDHPYRLIYGYLGLGVSGEIYGYSTLVRTLVFGGKKFFKVPLSVPDSASMKHVKVAMNSGLIGNSLLKKFKVIIHYPEKYLVLKRNIFTSRQIPYDKSGLVVKLAKPKLIEAEYTIYDHKMGGNDKDGFVQITGRTVKKLLTVRFVKVEEVLQGSPAQRAGMVKGDIVEAVNGRPIYELKNGLSDFSGLLSQKEGKKITLKIKRNGIPMQISFHLEDYYYRKQ